MKNPGAVEMRLILFFYGGLAFISLMWDFLSQGSFFYSWTESSAPRFFGVMIGLVFVGVYLGISQLVVLTTTWGKQLQLLLKKLLTPISYFQILVIAILSGFMEEWFFRGVLLNHFGVVVSSLLFALCHLILSQRLWIWSIWTFIFGFVFAELRLWSDSLLLVALLHTLINACSLVLLNLSAYEKPSLWNEGAAN